MTQRKSNIVISWRISTSKRVGHDFNTWQRVCNLRDLVVLERACPRLRPDQAKPDGLQHGLVLVDHAQLRQRVTYVEMHSVLAEV